MGRQLVSWRRLLSPRFSQTWQRDHFKEFEPRWHAQASRIVNKSTPAPTAQARRRRSLNLTPNWGEIEQEQRRLLDTVTIKQAPAD